MTPFKLATEESLRAFCADADDFMGPNVWEANYQALYAIKTPAVWVGKNRFLAHIQSPSGEPPVHVRVVTVAMKGLTANLGGRVAALRVDQGALWA